MKSVMQEASSIAKAIEQAWAKAGKPKDFSIKVLEEAQKNFFGLTTRSAKIALFFDERPASKHVPQQRPTPQPQREQRHNEPRPQRDQRQPQREINQPKYEAPKQEVSEPQHSSAQRQRHEPQWTEAMVTHAQEWLTETLKNMGKEAITFTIQQQHYHLRITLNTQLLPNIDKEKQLLASISALMIETLKRRFRSGLRGHKVVLTHA